MRGRAEPRNRWRAAVDSLPLVACIGQGHGYAHGLPIIPAVPAVSAGENSARSLSPRFRASLRRRGPQMSSGRTNPLSWHYKRHAEG